MDQRSVAIDLAARAHWLAIANADQRRHTRGGYQLGHRPRFGGDEPLDHSDSFQCHLILPAHLPLNRSREFLYAEIAEIERSAFGLEPDVTGNGVELVEL